MAVAFLLFPVEHRPVYVTAVLSPRLRADVRMVFRIVKTCDAAW
jgi:hypothetical protein